MGPTRNEISGFRKAGDHPAGRAIASTGASDSGEARRLSPDLLSMVRSLSDRRPEALEDRSPRPQRVWNRIPDEMRGQLVQLALEEPELSPRELATRFTDTESYFVSEASVYRLLKDHDLIASPAYIVVDRLAQPEGGWKKFDRVSAWRSFFYKDPYRQERRRDWARTAVPQAA